MRKKHVQLASIILATNYAGTQKLRRASCWRPVCRYNTGHDKARTGNMVAYEQHSNQHWRKTCLFSAYLNVCGKGHARRQTEEVKYIKQILLNA